VSEREDARFPTCTWGGGTERERERSFIDNQEVTEGR
jgi:hypothetical protein